MAFIEVSIQFGTFPAVTYWVQTQCGTGVRPFTADLKTRDTGVRPFVADLTTRGTGVRPFTANLKTRDTGVRPFVADLKTRGTEVRLFTADLMTGVTNAMKSRDTVANIDKYGTEVCPFAEKSPNCTWEANNASYSELMNVERTKKCTSAGDVKHHIQIASTDNLRTIHVFHPNPHCRSRKISSVQIMDAHYVEIWEGKRYKKNSCYKKETFQKVMTKSMKRNARRTQQRSLQRVGSIQPQTVIQDCPLIATSNAFEVLHQIVKTSDKNGDEISKTDRKSVYERLGAQKKPIHELLGPATQKVPMHQRLGLLKPSVFERLWPQPKTQWVKKQKEYESSENFVYAQNTPKLTVHAWLDSENSPESPVRKVEVMMVDKRPNFYTTPRNKKLQKLPEEQSEIEQLANREGVQTRMTAKAREVLEARISAPRSMVLAPRSNSPNRMPVMMADASDPTPEQRELERLRAQMEERDRMIAEKDNQLTQLTARFNSLIEMMNTRNINVPRNSSPHTTSTMAGAPSTSNGTTSEGTNSNMTQDAILQAIETIISKKLGELGAYAPATSRNYVKPYPTWHDDIPFPMGYHQPKFKEFDGTGCPHEHIAHFLSACGDTARSNSLLLRQFVQTLKGAAFEWYSKLAPGSIYDWDTMKSQFMSRFYNTKRTISVSELVTTKQNADERAADFITRWRNISIHCSQVLDQHEAVKLCMNNLHPWLALFLHGGAPTTFETLSTTATNAEIHLQQNPDMLARLKGSSVNKAPTTNVYMIDSVTPKSSSGNSSRPVRRIIPLEERRKKEYPFRRDKIAKLFKHALEKGLIQLPAPKRPNEVDKIDDPNYCVYHRCLGHRIEDCWVFLDQLMNLHEEKKITFSKNVLKDPTNIEANPTVR